MNKTVAILIVLAVAFFGTLFVGGGYTLSTLNKEASLSTTIHAKHESNLAEYSNMKSKIKGAAQVSDREATLITDTILGYSENRGGSAGSGGLINAVSEAVPNIDAKTLQNLQNIVIGSRNTWTARQTELASLSQKHNEMFARPISGLVLGIFGKEQIDIKIVATAQSKVDFDTETETEVDLF